MKFDDLREDLRQGFGSLWGTMSEGWDRLRHTAAGALTRFRPGEKTALPLREEVDDVLYLPNHHWAMLGGDVFEDEQRLVVRIEAPGLEKGDFDVQVHDGQLQIRGEKRFERESTEGRWRVLQCAYGSFQRNVPLPVPVKGDEAVASYRNGVLRVTLPKAEAAKPRKVDVQVS